MTAKLAAALAALVLVAACDSRTAKEKGQDLAAEKVDLVQGAGEVVRDRGKEVGGTVAEGVGNVLSGMGKGFDASLNAKKIVLADPAAAPTVQPTRAQDMTAGKGISVYLMSENGFDGSLRLIALSNGAEVGRVTVAAKIDKGDAQYVDFGFDERVPLTSVDQYTLAVVAKP